MVPSGWRKGGPLQLVGDTDPVGLDANSTSSTIHRSDVTESRGGVLWYTWASSRQTTQPRSAHGWFLGVLPWLQ